MRAAKANVFQKGSNANCMKNKWKWHVVRGGHCYTLSLPLSLSLDPLNYALVSRLCNCEGSILELPPALLLLLPRCVAPKRENYGFNYRKRYTQNNCNGKLRNALGKPGCMGGKRQTKRDFAMEVKNEKKVAENII